jgi:hypothetical protein
LTVEVLAILNHATKRRERMHDLYVVRGLSREETVATVVSER